MPNEINPETILSTTEKPLTLMRWLKAVQKTNAEIAEKLNEIEGTLNGKVAKAGDTMTGDLSVPNINVNSNANVGKLNSEKINQKYEGAIKSELHVDEQGIVEFVNGSNAGRFDTAKVIKPSEVKTEIYDNQQGKRMFFRLPYLEASEGEHRLLTEEDLGGSGLSIERFILTSGDDSVKSMTIRVDIVNDYFVVINLTGTARTQGYSAENVAFTLTEEQKSKLLNIMTTNLYAMPLVKRGWNTTLSNCMGSTLSISGNSLGITLGTSIDTQTNIRGTVVISKWSV